MKSKLIKKVVNAISIATPHLNSENTPPATFADIVMCAGSYDLSSSNTETEHVIARWVEVNDRDKPIEFTNMKVVNAFSIEFSSMSPPKAQALDIWALARAK